MQNNQTAAASYKPRKLSKGAKGWELFDAHVLANAECYTATLQLAPDEKLHARCATKEEAIEKAREFNKQSHYGRRAIVYAVAGNSIAQISYSF